MPSILPAFLLGVVAGLRSMTAPAAIAWAAATNRLPVDGTWAAVAARPLVRWGLLLAAAAELVADKLPFTPSRKRAGPFAGRVASGALCGAVLGSTRGATTAGALAGAIGAVAGTLGGHAARARLARALGRDMPAALIEDAVAVGLAGLALRFAGTGP